jgi:hypothetical protein
VRTLADKKTYEHAYKIQARPTANSTTWLLQVFERRQVAGAVPNAFLNARENAASDS